jgi:hypothetical protein
MTLASTINFSDTVPAAGAGNVNVAWQNDGGSPTVNISAEYAAVAAPETAEVVTFSGTAGTLAFTPVGDIFLYRNGVYQRSIGPGTPNYSITGTAITLAVAAGGTDVFIAVYSH